MFLFYCPNTKIPLAFLAKMKCCFWVFNFKIEHFFLNFKRCLSGHVFQVYLERPADILMLGLVKCSFQSALSPRLSSITLSNSRKAQRIPTNNFVLTQSFLVWVLSDSKSHWCPDCYQILGQDKTNSLLCIFLYSLL